ncbi:sirohydrochlorin cobaltochelatase [Pelosinus sp. IPA-1]|uniref:sirohydrochlorin cobaltochelatase n=1 Tax=Pelosinus sp. IPA-1 TaxID=3029569 RepID=UPI002436248D|nr:sirohydrochlorin cobaltochelatase [Pelosinus sp. IPA-1]GMB01560.1 sirohydrochlorin cobaltochelatase [Pelosinus sp. IPA-1]
MEEAASAVNCLADKRAILVVSFGTTYLDTLKMAIESTESKIRATFPNYEVRRAFTSRIVIKKLAERDGILIDTEKQALERLQAEGYKEVFIQPLYVAAAEEYEKLREVSVHFAHTKVFDKITLGRPLLYYMGQKGNPDDYLIAIKAVETQLPKLRYQEAIVLMGHGGVHPANTAYAALQIKLEEAGLNNIFVYTVEGFPALDSVIEKLKSKKVKNVTLLPFMLVAGDHATKDMAGDEEDSAKSQLLKAGFNVDIYFHGLGENLAIQDIYVQHLKDAIDQLIVHKAKKH